MKKIVVIEGVSGAGKDTLMNEMVKREPNTFIKMPSMTSRKMRSGETEGNPYYFVTGKEFEKRVESGEIFEFTRLVRDDEYRGMSKKIIDTILDSGKIPLKDCDHIGLKALQVEYGKENVISIFLDVPKKEIEKRIIGRGGNEEDIKARIKDFEEYIKINRKHYKYHVENIDMEECIKKICKIIESYLY